MVFAFHERQDSEIAVTVKESLDIVCKQMMSLPLFMGMSSNDIMQLLNDHPIAYHAYGDGKTVAEADMPCDVLTIAVSGRLRVCTTPDDHNYMIEEQVDAPSVIQPERLFGLSPRYTRTFVTCGRCAVMCISKSDVVKISDSYQIFRINLLNTISTQAQRLARIPWRHVPETLRARIIHFIGCRCLAPTGPKKISIKKARLAKKLNVCSRNLSAELHRMEEDGLVRLRRETIEIDCWERMPKG